MKQNVAERGEATLDVCLQKTVKVSCNRSSISLTGKHRISYRVQRLIKSEGVYYVFTL